MTPRPAKKPGRARVWSGHLFGGRVRTSTLVLILAFGLVWWVYDTYQPPKPPAAPQVVPPGFIPDPNYTWVPRTRLQQPPSTVTKVVTPPPSTVTVPPATTEPPPPPWPFCLPNCAPPPGPGSSPAPEPGQPSPEPGQQPSSPITTEPPR